MEFSQYGYISIVAFRSASRSDVTIRSKRWKDASFQLGFHLAKHFTPTYCVKTADNNFLRSWIDNTIRRGTLPVSGVYLNNFPFIIRLTPGPLLPFSFNPEAWRFFCVCLLFKLNGFVWFRITFDQWNLGGYVAKLTRFLVPFEHVLFTCSETFQVSLHESLLVFAEKKMRKNLIKTS